MVFLNAGGFPCSPLSHSYTNISTMPFCTFTPPSSLSLCEHEYTHTPTHTSPAPFRAPTLGVLPDLSLRHKLKPKKRCCMHGEQSNTPLGHGSIHRTQSPLLRCHSPNRVRQLQPAPLSNRRQLSHLCLFTLSVCTLLSLFMVCLFWLARKKIRWHRNDRFSELTSFVSDGGMLGWTSEPRLEGTLEQFPSTPHPTPPPQIKTNCEAASGGSWSHPVTKCAQGWRFPPKPL